MTIKISQAQKAKYAISGHVGVGHVHSHSGFVQDDSVGFAVASLILKKAIDVNTKIANVETDPHTNTITVTTQAGGTATLSPRRGITPREAEIIKEIIGEEALYTQNIAIKALGRIYGQGISEVATTLQGACALAVLNSFKNKLGDKLKITKEKFENKYDVSAGIILDIDETPVSLMLVINGTNGGIGPDEDYEGNTNWSEKGTLIKELGADTIPTVVIESKAFIPSMADKLTENQLMIRAEEGIDCSEMAEALHLSAKELQIPARYEKGLMPMPNGALEKATHAFADKIIEQAEKLKTIDLAKDKTEIVAELAKLISEDAGGVTFMSNSVNDKVRGAGILPEITAVLSMVTTKEYQSYWKIPQLEEKEANNYISVIIEAINKLKAN
ncbi:MAG: hypothetical protein RR272_01815 [Synergistaceae bacterium]